MSNQYDPRYAHQYGTSQPAYQHTGQAGMVPVQPGQHQNQWSGQVSPQGTQPYPQQPAMLQGTSTVPPGGQPVTGAYQHAPTHHHMNMNMPPQPVAPAAPQPVQTTAEEDDFFGAFSSKSGETFPEERPQPAAEIRAVRQNSFSATSSIGSRSTRSTRSGHSGKSTGSILDDKRYAPPPKYPKETLQMMKTQVFSDGRNAASALPSFDMVKHSGSITARISLKTLVMKKWKYSFWIAYGNNSLLFFRSKPDFEDWLVNPYLSKEGRDELVKLKIDFVNDLYISGMNGYKASSIRFKNYGKSGLLHQFKLEKWMSYGPTIVAAFASKNENDVSELRTIMNEMIRASPQRNRVLGTEDDNDNSAYNSDNRSYHSGRSERSQRSAFSAQGLQEKLSGMMGGSNRSIRSGGSMGSGRYEGGGYEQGRYEGNSTGNSQGFRY